MRGINIAKIITLTVLAINGFSYAEISNIKIEQFEPIWLGSNETQQDFPNSAVYEDEEVVTNSTNDGIATSVEVTTDNSTDNSPIPADDFGVRQEFGHGHNQQNANNNNEDLSANYIPSYCRCISKYYCSGANYQVVRSKRAINTPQCKNRDEVMCCLTTGPGCGVPANFPYFNPYPIYGEANYGDSPWSALLMDTNNQVIYGLGILVSWKVVLTTARNVQSLPAGRTSKLKVRLGEWDLATNDEPFKAQEYAVSEIIIHPNFNPRTYQNDIAILRLANYADLSSFPSIRSGCIAKPNDQNKFTNAKCLVAGWGVQPSVKKRITNGATNNINKVQPQAEVQRNILKEVDMQIINGDVCQDALRRNVGDRQFLLDQRSFLCAGGEQGKGLCKGDEGAALVCKDARSDRYTVVGMASWATTCGQPGFPTVFTNLGTYYDWIKTIDPQIGQY